MSKQVHGFSQPFIYDMQLNCVLTMGVWPYNWETDVLSSCHRSSFLACPWAWAKRWKTYALLPAKGMCATASPREAMYNLTTQYPPEWVLYTAYHMFDIMHLLTPLPLEASRCNHMCASKCDSCCVSCQGIKKHKVWGEFEREAEFMCVWQEWREAGRMQRAAPGSSGTSPRVTHSLGSITCNMDSSVLAVWETIVVLHVVLWSAPVSFHRTPCVTLVSVNFVTRFQLPAVGPLF